MNIKEDRIIKRLKYRISYFRIAYRMHQTDVAEYMDVNNRMISAYENGLNDPDIYEFEKICKLYGIPYRMTGKYGQDAYIAQNQAELMLLELYRKQPVNIKNMIYKCLCDSIE
ncbi:MAG: helix-turn-helix transcriptional regulator [Solobacterium sp.]|nr:helix-turn-helix transcriptional regulator [Solobacterium sp.]